MAPAAAVKRTLLRARKIISTVSRFRELTPGLENAKCLKGESQFSVRREAVGLAGEHESVRHASKHHTTDVVTLTTADEVVTRLREKITPDLK